MSPRRGARKTISNPNEIKVNRESDEKCKVADDDDCEDDIVTLETRPGHTRVEMDQGKEQQTTNVVVTGGALTFVVLAAILVTASFLMSPVIEQVFGKRCSTFLSLFVSVCIFVYFIFVYSIFLGVYFM